MKSKVLNIALALNCLCSILVGCNRKSKVGNVQSNTQKTPDETEKSKPKDSEVTINQYTQCYYNFRTWIDKYASNSPVLAFNKTQSTQISQQEVQALIDKESKIFFSQALKLNSKFYNNLEMGSLESVRDLNYKLKDNYQKIKNFEFIVKSKKTQDLIIAWQPYKILYDTFLESNLTESVSYAAQPSQDSDTYFTPSYLEFAKILGMTAVRYEIMRDKTLTQHTTFLAALLNSLHNGGTHTVENIFIQKSNYSPSVIMIGSNSYLNRNEITNDFLQPNCLSTLGYKSITVVLPQLKANRFYTYEEVMNVIDLKKYWFRQLPVDSKGYLFLKNNDVSRTPSLEFFTNRINSYSLSIPVRFTGLD